jgi:YHS domain-containing protein
MIEWDNAEELEDDPEYFECPNDDCECERRTDTDGTDYWFCEECCTSFDDDGNEVYPEAEDIEKDED